MPIPPNTLFNKNPVPGMGNFLSSCWSGEFKKCPKQYKLSLLSLIASQMESNILSLMIQHTLNTELGGIHIDLT